MRKYNFIKTRIPSEDYEATGTVGTMVYARFGATKIDADTYVCAETVVSADDYDAAEAEEAYKQWKAEYDASELRYAKRRKLGEIERYDTSDKVNGFKLNGNVFWLDKATRVGLMNSTTIAKGMGNATTDLWLGDVKLTIDCDKVIRLLGGIEMYALECFNVTARHKAEVQKLKTVEDVVKYDIKEGYPKQLEINLDGLDRQ